MKLGISRGGGEQEVAVTIGKRNNSMNAMQQFEGFEGFEGLENLKGLEKLEELQGRYACPERNVWKWEGQGRAKTEWSSHLATTAASVSARCN